MTRTKAKVYTKPMKDATGRTVQVIHYSYTPWMHVADGRCCFNLLCEVGEKYQQDVKKALAELIQRTGGAVGKADFVGAPHFAEILVPA